MSLLPGHTQVLAPLPSCRADISPASCCLPCFPARLVAHTLLRHRGTRVSAVDAREKPKYHVLALRALALSVLAQGTADNGEGVWRRSDCVAYTCQGKAQGESKRLITP